ncbi:hypothetical protein 2 [Changjiang picorna-like virus 12]|uniref:hypothetical protein 2 n=1 Tax=Changjiang picorna-like virus 12 TaxID=1922785 RepID=UPI00090B4C73|nr:hypothetical protein 2 [Changjiang picorna-like virus 12]APG78999.1 hypothetical protein 2 [Changjiang picorna-like virus 12]
MGGVYAEIRAWNLKRWTDPPTRITETYQDTHLQIDKTIGSENSFGDTGGISISLGHTDVKPNAAQAQPTGHFYDDKGGSIEQFLSRPKLLAAYTLGATNTATTFPKVNILKKIIDDYRDKIVGKYCMAFDIEFTIEVSATRFQQGRYMFCYLPSFYFNGGTGTDDTTLSSWKVSHAATLTQCTQLQHVEFDLNVDKAVTLTIPFRYFNPFMEIIYTPGASNTPTIPDYGIVFLRPYVPLSVGAGGTANADVNIWYSLKNVKFYGTANYQSAADQEAKSVGDGPISGPLGVVTKTLNGLSDVPFIGHYARPASWVSEALGRVAKHFGFSSPTIQNGVTPLYNMPYGYGANTDVPRPVQSLSYTTSNSVTESSEVTGSKVDEMSIKYLAGIYAYKTGFDWGTGLLRNALLFETAVNPLLPYSTTTILNVLPETVYHHNPAGYIASRFKFWRGTIKYKLKLVKTEFHTGKLLVCWHPGNESIFNHTAPPDVGASYYRYRQVIDISVGNEFEFSVPYMSPRNWKNVVPVNPTSSGNTNADFANGFFSILVLDTLKAPENVNQTIRLLLEVAGGEDFAVMGATPTSFYAESETGHNAPRFVYAGEYQSATQMPAENSTLVSYSFGSHLPMERDKNISACQVSGGEYIETLRKVLKRYTRAFRTPASGTNVYHLFGPFSAPHFYAPGAATAIVQAEDQDDFAYYGQMFCFYRGSTRFRIAFAADSPGSANLNRHQHRVALCDLNTTGQVSLFNGGAAVAGTTCVYPGLDSAAVTYAVSSLTEAVEVSLPYATADANVLVQTLSVPGNGIYGIWLNSASPGTCAYMGIHKSLVPSTITLATTFDRAIGDDASFSYFVSCPPVNDDRLFIQPT